MSEIYVILSASLLRKINISPNFNQLRFEHNNQKPLHIGCYLSVTLALDLVTIPAEDPV